MITLPATIVAIAIVTPPLKSRNLSTTHEERNTHSVHFGWDLSN